MKKFLLSAALLLSLSACSMQSTPFINSTDVRDVDFSTIGSMREGRDCAYWILFFGPFGNNSLIEAVKNGGIRKVEVVDKSVHAYPFVAKECIRVYGR